MTKKRIKRYKETSNKKANDESTRYAFLAAILSIIGFVIAILLKKDDKYVMYYAKQSLVIFIIGAVGGALGALLLYLPIIGAIINFGIFIVVFAAWLISWIYALSGEEKEIFIISDLAKNFNF